MYRQGYLDQARVRNQYAYYPSPNFAAMSGFEDLKQLPTAYMEGIKAFKPVQLMGVVGAGMIVTSFIVKPTKKIAKGSKITQQMALRAGGGLMSVISLYMTYQELSS